MKTGAPSGTRENSETMSGSLARRQPGGASAPQAVGGAVDRDPVAADPVRGQVRLVAGQSEDAAAVVAPGLPAREPVGDRVGAGRRRRAGAADPHIELVEHPLPVAELQPLVGEVDPDGEWGLEELDRRGVVHDPSELPVRQVRDRHAEPVPAPLRDPEVARGPELRGVAQRERRGTAGAPAHVDLGAGHDPRDLVVRPGDPLRRGLGRLDPLAESLEQAGVGRPLFRSPIPAASRGHDNPAGQHDRREPTHRRRGRDSNPRGSVSPLLA